MTTRNAIKTLELADYPADVIEEETQFNLYAAIDKLLKKEVKSFYAK